MEVSLNEGTPKSSILIGFSLINHPFWGTPIPGTPRINIPPKKSFALDGTRCEGPGSESRAALGPRHTEGW